MSISMSEIIIVEDLQALSRTAAELFVTRADAVLKEKPFFTVALSGGSTPKDLYTQLASGRGIRNKIEWQKVHFFWGDERHVAPDHPQSNFRMANDAMLTSLPLAPQNIHRIPSEDTDADRAARRYEQELIRFFQLRANQYPRFDLIWLGLGSDGHTASLFPQSAALTEKKRLVAANWVEKIQSHRITMTPAVLNHAECIIFLVSGAHKAGSLKQVLEGGDRAEQLPAQLIQPLHGKLYWLIDRAAAGELEHKEAYRINAKENH